MDRKFNSEVISLCARLSGIARSDAYKGNIYQSVPAIQKFHMYGARILEVLRYQTLSGIISSAFKNFKFFQSLAVAMLQLPIHKYNMKLLYQDRGVVLHWREGAETSYNSIAYCM